MPGRPTDNDMLLPPLSPSTRFYEQRVLTFTFYIFPGCALRALSHRIAELKSAERCGMRLWQTDTVLECCYITVDVEHYNAEKAILQATMKFRKMHMSALSDHQAKRRQTLLCCSQFKCVNSAGPNKGSAAFQLHLIIWYYE